MEQEQKKKKTKNKKHCWEVGRTKDLGWKVIETKDSR